MPGDRKTMVSVLCGSLLAMSALVGACQMGPARSSQTEREVLPAAPQLPFAKAVRVGSTIYLSGELGIDPKTGQLAPGGVEAETTQALKNIETTLAKMSAKLSDLVRCRVYLADIQEWPAMNRAYRAALGDALPARAAMGGVELARNARLELECTAHRSTQP